MNALSLFSGCGAYDLGLKWAGFTIIGGCEVDPDAAAIYRKNFPGVPLHGDVRQLTGAGIPVKPDLVIAGWPCQDLSTAGPGSGLRGERSGLWSECARLVRELRPSYVILENSPELLRGWLGEVLGDLADLGYNAEWEVLSAAALGAPHFRERLAIIAYAAGFGPSRPGGLFNAFHSTPAAYREADRLVDAVQRQAVPFVCRGHDGTSKGFHGARLKAIGNVGFPPQLVEQIGRAILATETSRERIAA